MKNHHIYIKFRYRYRRHRGLESCSSLNFSSIRLHFRNCLSSEYNYNNFSCLSIFQSFNLSNPNPIKFCSSKSNDRNLGRTLLQSLAQQLKIQIDNGHVSLLNVYESTLTKIVSLHLAVADGAHIRSRTRWEEEGEASTSYFFLFGKEKWCGGMVFSDAGV